MTRPCPVCGRVRQVHGHRGTRGVYLCRDCKDHPREPLEAPAVLTGGAWVPSGGIVRWRPRQEAS